MMRNDSYKTLALLGVVGGPCWKRNKWLWKTWPSQRLVVPFINAEGG